MINNIVIKKPPLKRDAFFSCGTACIVILSHTKLGHFLDIHLLTRCVSHPPTRIILGFHADARV